MWDCTSSDDIQNHRGCFDTECKQTPTKISELEDDVGLVKDPDYVHTDNNFTNDYKNILDTAGDLSGLAEEARKQADRAKEYADNPPKISEDNYNWHVWDEVNDVYKDTGVCAKGEKGDDGNILYPKFEVRDDMHLEMDTEAAFDRVSYNENTGYITLDI